MASHEWFLTSSTQSIADLKTVTAEDSDYFVKLDVRDFHMTGVKDTCPENITHTLIRHAKDVTWQRLAMKHEIGKLKEDYGSKRLRPC